jgi:hypothetical protein
MTASTAFCRLSDWAFIRQHFLHDFYAMQVRAGIGPECVVLETAKNIGR